VLPIQTNINLNYIYINEIITDIISINIIEVYIIFYSWTESSVLIGIKYYNSRFVSNSLKVCSNVENP